LVKLGTEFRTIERIIDRPVFGKRDAEFGRSMFFWRSRYCRREGPSRMDNELFDICCERDPDPADQRKRLLKLLKAGADVHATDKNGVTALHHAVRFRSPVAVKALTAHGANVNQACRRNGSTPLHRAATQTGAPGTAGKGQATGEIIRILLAAGADPAIKNKLGKKPADYVKDDTLKSLLNDA
jgi:tankyrase